MAIALIIPEILEFIQTEKTKDFNFNGLKSDKGYGMDNKKRKCNNFDDNAKELLAKRVHRYKVNI